FSDTPLRVFEMGFGSGLNALLTAAEASSLQRSIQYTTIEAYPLTREEIDTLNYGEALNNEPLFAKLHQAAWDETVVINPFFTLQKIQTLLANVPAAQLFNVIYYDAFAPAAQPELWTQAVFEKLYNMLVPGGSLVTYCSKGDVRRSMQAAGFHVSKLQGPPGKREMLRATKA
ncbi:MAG TPA: tRNA (5-methylaminomethyl-2-thiouridine)(34)-methyltransferase MnmD, partial [Flavisolibacter sp.]|nr:tRNA (5-methylaminomethyl-2-thiouridine)(34)-methyltransferase MnmD [Flavisolibacter sp.]